MKKKIDNPEYLIAEAEKEITEKPVKVPDGFSKRVLDKTFTAIHSQKKKYIYKKNLVKAAVVCLCFCLISGSAAVYAKIEGRIPGVFKVTPDIDKEINHPEPVQTPETGLEPQAEAKRRLSYSKIADSGTFSDTYIDIVADDVSLSRSGKITNIAFDSNNAAVFLFADEAKHFLKKGQRLSLTLTIDTSFAGSEERGESLSFGYIKNGKFFEIEAKRAAPDAAFEFIPDEDGIYYPCLINGSLSYIKIDDLEIKID